MDEAGVNNQLFREYARALRGKKVHARIPGKKRERISMMGGWFQHQFIAPMTFKGGCYREILNTWLKNILLKIIPKGTTIIMDNAAFHKHSSTREIIEEAGCFLKFLPTYSPDLNPIEHCWHTLKSRLKPLMHQYNDLQELVGKCLLTL